MERSGVYAENLRLKVTKEPKHWDKVSRIPCQAGFKQQDAWVNRWVDVVWFAKNGPAPQVAKGDVIYVTGRWVETERTGNDGNKYEGREVLADEVRTTATPKQSQATPERGQWKDDQVPF
jgi:single-stranded DNA-binding protein